MLATEILFLVASFGRRTSFPSLGVKCNSTINFSYHAKDVMVILTYYKISVSVRLIGIHIL